MAWVFIIFILAWPVLEIATFIQVAGYIGLPLALLGILLSGVLGIAVMRQQSLSSASRVQAQIAKGEMPMREMFENAAGALAGLLLLIPGYVTDVLGLLLLLPPVRNLIYGEIALLVKTSLRKAQSQSIHDGPTVDLPPDVTVIDGDYKVVNPDDRPKPGPRRPPLMLL